MQWDDRNYHSMLNFGFLKLRVTWKSKEKEWQGFINGECLVAIKPKDTADKESLRETCKREVMVQAATMLSDMTTQLLVASDKICG